jgi:plasmid stabilization system protein ParE
MTVSFVAAAKEELEDAIGYYESQSPGLGFAFASEIKDGLIRVVEFPNSWQLIGPRVRRYRLRRFPYGIVYVSRDAQITVLAVMHLHREPSYWKAR